MQNNNENDTLILVKVGGSSITGKNQRIESNMYALRFTNVLLDGQLTDLQLTHHEFSNMKTQYTDKASFETLNVDALQWFAKAIASSIHERFKTLSSTSDKENGNASFIVIHGAGSFGHHIAKEYGLKGQEAISNNSLSDASVIKRRMTGLAKTRSR